MKKRARRPNFYQYSFICARPCLAKDICDEQEIPYRPGFGYVRLRTQEDLDKLVLFFKLKHQDKLYTTE